MLKKSYYYKSKLIDQFRPPFLIMNVTLESFPKKDYLLIESKGTVETMEELLEHSQMIWEEIRKYGFKKILIDEPGVTFLQDVVPYFNLVKSYVENFPKEINELKIATVMSEEHIEIGQTWESLCQSRGLQYFMFTKFDDALNCLTNDDNE